MKSAVCGAILLCATSTLAYAQDLKPREIDLFVADPVIMPADAAAMTTACDAYLDRIATERQALETETGPARFDTTFRRLDDVYLVALSAIAQASLVMNTAVEADVRTAAQGCMQRTGDVITDLGLSRPIYDRIEAIDPEGAEAEQRFLRDRFLRDARLFGTDRDEATRARLGEIQRQITAASLTFARNIADARLTLRATPAELDGLPADWLAARPAGEDGLIEISTDYPDLQPVMGYAHDSDLRRRLYVLNNNRAWPVNDAVLAEVVAARHDMAGILGFADFASMDLANRMVDTPAKARDFVDGISQSADAPARRDLALMLARLRRDDPSITTVAPWSTGYVQQVLRREDYDVDPQVVRRYFAYDNVRDGIFRLTQDLFGVEIRPWDPPVWAEGVEAFEMYEDGVLLGRFYLDNHPREGKFSHAAVFPIRTGIEGRAVPVGAMVSNFPAGDHSTGLMEHGQVETFLHEFGHMLHLLFAGRQDWTMQNPFLGLEADFTEAPSTMLENWVWDYDTLRTFAVNAEGETIPEDLVQRMNRARGFAKASGDRRQMGYAAVALDLYTGAPTDDLTQLYLASYNRYAMETVEGVEVHPHAAFGHLTGYGSAYYTYLWSRAISDDLFTRFESNGLRDAETARRYRELVLAPGSSRPAMRLVEDFLERSLSLQAYRDSLTR